MSTSDAWDQAQIELMLAAGDEKNLAQVPMALRNQGIPDPVWSEGICLALCRHSTAQIRGSAVIALGHLAKTTGILNRECVTEAVSRALSDEDKHVRDHAQSAAETIHSHLGWSIVPSDTAVDRSCPISDLMEAVQALALPGAVQQARFENCSAIGDELALEFEAALECCRKVLLDCTAQQRQSLANLDDYLDELSNIEDPSVWWTAGSLCSDPHWERVRELAKLVLVAFAWPLEGVAKLGPEATDNDGSRTTLPCSDIE